MNSEQVITDLIRKILELHSKELVVRELHITVTKDKFLFISAREITDNYEGSDLENSEKYIRRVFAASSRCIFAEHLSEEILNLTDNLSKLILSLPKDIDLGNLFQTVIKPNLSDYLPLLSQVIFRDTSSIN